MKNVLQIFGIVTFVLALLAPQLSYGQVKAGDYHKGGIVVYVDASGQHGIVCQTRDLGEMDWFQAVVACSNLGNGWRLPTKQELHAMYVNLYKRGIGNFTDDYYWSSSDLGDEDDVWDQDFDDGETNFGGKEGYDEYVRAVRNF